EPWPRPLSCRRHPCRHRPAAGSRTRGPRGPVRRPSHPRYVCASPDRTIDRRRGLGVARGPRRALFDLERTLEELDDAFEEAGPLAAAFREAEQIPPQERRETLARTRLVSAVMPLLKWLGTGRPTTSTGGGQSSDRRQHTRRRSAGTSGRAPADAHVS